MEPDEPNGDHARPLRRTRRSLGIWVLIIAAFLILVLVAPGIHPWRDTPSDRAPTPTQAGPAPSPQSINTAQVAQCEAVIRQGQELGLIRTRPQPQRIDVDERLWGVMEVSERRGLLLALRCSAFRGAPAEGDAALAFGAQSGKKLAEARVTGVVFE